MEIYGPIIIKNAQASGTGDPLLTRDASSGAMGTTTNALGTLPSAQIFVGNGSNVATAVAVSGDITLSNAGVVAIAAGAIVNADVNESAAIAYSKLAALTASRALVSDVSGVVSVATTTATELGYVNGVTSAIQTQLNSKQATITGGATTIVSLDLTANRALLSNASGKVAVSSVTNTELGYVSGVTSAIQTQLNTKLAATITSPVQGDILRYNGSAWVNLARGADGTVLQSTASDVQWGAPTANGLPTGGTVGQYLRKSSVTNYDAAWDTLTISDVTDITASAAELNILDGATIDVNELNFLENASANIQTQLDNKLSTSLATDNILVGVGGIATATTNLPVGTTIGSAVIYRVGGSDVTLADGGTGASLVDPGADRIMFWDDSAGQTTWLTVGTGLSITGTTIDATSAISDGDKGDVTVSSSGTVWSVDANINKAWTGTHSFLDNSLSILDNSDTSKIAQFQLSGLTTATTRTYTLPDISGNVVVTGGTNTLSAATTLSGTSTNTLTGLFTALGTTVTDGAGLWLRNTTAASSGNQQISPVLTLEGQGWKTNATAASQSVKWAAYNLPVQSAANPTSNLVFTNSINGGAYSDRARLRSDGGLDVSDTGSFSATVAGITYNGALSNMFRLGSSGTLIFNITTNGAIAHNRSNAGATSVSGYNYASTALTSLPTGTEFTDWLINTNATYAWAGSTTIADQGIVKIVAPTYSAGSATTMTNGSTLRITGAPTAAGSMTITNPYALRVDSGATYLGGNVFLPSVTQDDTKTRILAIDSSTGRAYYRASSTLGGITNTAAANEVMKSDGTNAVSSNIFVAVDGHEFRDTTNKVVYKIRTLEPSSATLDKQSQVLSSSEISDGENVTISIQWALKDNATNTGGGGMYITNWTKEAGVLAQSFQNDTIKGDNVSGTVAITTLDSGGNIMARCTGMAGNANVSWVATIVIRRP
jgi:hypothetical protein